MNQIGRQDQKIIDSISKEIGTELKQLDKYEWDHVGYVVNSDGRVEVLNLHDLKIGWLPKGLKALSELKTLHLVANKLSSVEEIKHLNQLTTLVLQNNHIETLSFCEELSSLKALYLSYNPIEDINPVKNLQNLEFLLIQHAGYFDTSPIGSLQQLQELRISLNSYSKIDFLLTCRNLARLKSYAISSEKKHLPTNLCDYLAKINVDDLTFSGYQSIDIDSIAQLTNLNSLAIMFSETEEIQSLSTMIQLQTLNLLKNSIKDIQGLSKLTQLQHLNIGFNQIVDISPLAELPLLKAINLSKNPITDLKPLLNHPLKFYVKDTQFEAEDNKISIGGCENIVNPPIEIVKQGDAAIRRYFEKIAEEGIEYIYEAKLILVGEGSAGKTSLQKRLIDSNAKLPASDKRTRGIEVVDYVFEEEANNSKIAHIWDFGGQDVYYPVHRFFITENSVFVLMASTRQTSHNFDYWIPTIYQFGGKSPIIIGQTCHDGNTAPWNDIDVYLSNGNFNIIKTQKKPFYKLDLPNQNEGLEVIKDCITHQIKNLHHFGKGVPKSWLTVRNQLLEKSTTDPCIPFHAFIELCRTAEPDSFEELQEIEDCCQFFHEIGVVLWYSGIEDLWEWVVLQPDWAMNAVYKIIDDTNIQERNGHIQADDFGRLWCERSYESKHTVLKKMLETFKIAFPKKHATKEYIIPARLSSIPIENRWKLEEKSLRLQYNFEFMPRGIVNQLSAELSRYIHSTEVWNNAVNLDYDNSYTNCQIIEDSYYRNVTIDSRGIDARGMNMLVMDAMENIIDSYKGVKAKIVIKCTCSECQQMEEPTEFSYEKLTIRLLEKGRKFVTCNESDERLDIEELLYKTGLPTPIKKIELSQTTKTIKIFLASSKELKDDRNAIEVFIGRENKRLKESGVFLQLDIWEDYIDKMSKTRLQDEYNKAVKYADIFLSLFWTKAGKYTVEEFGEAYAHFKETGKPYIYTYFKNKSIKPNDIRQRDMNSLLDFKDQLQELGHFPSHYENIDDLKNQFKAQLERIIPDLL